MYIFRVDKQRFTLRNSKQKVTSNNSIFNVKSTRWAQVEFKSSFKVKVKLCFQEKRQKVVAKLNSYKRNIENCIYMVWGAEVILYSLISM